MLEALEMVPTDKRPEAESCQGQFACELNPKEMDGN
jgi:hypothetical protein